MSIKQAKELGGKAFKEQWGPILLVLLLGLAGTIAANVVVPVVGGLIVCGTIAVGMLFVCYKATCGEKIEYKEMLVGFKRNFGEIVLASLLKAAFLAGVSTAAYGIIATFTLIFAFVPVLAIIFDILLGIAAIVALIIVSLYLAAVEYIMMREPEAKGWEAVKKSKRIMTGNTGSLFGFTLSFIGWFILTAIFFPLAIYTAPYFYMSRLHFIGAIYDKAEGAAQPSVPASSPEVKAEKAEEAAEEKETDSKAEEKGTEKTESETKETNAKEAPKRFCTACGNPVKEDASFCSKCGKPLK